MQAESAGGRGPTAIDVFLTFLLVYAATASRAVPWSDARPMWEAAQSLATEGDFTIATRWPNDAPLGLDGRVYPLATLLACLVHVPGALLMVAARSLAPSRASGLEAFAAQLAPISLGAVTVALLFGILRRQGLTARAATGATLLFGLGASTFVYAHRAYSEIAQAACFTGFFGALLRAHETPDAASAKRLGAWAGMLINAKAVFFLSLPGALLFLLYRLWRTQTRPWAPIAWSMATMAPGLLLACAYNQLRWGSPLATGYEANFTRDLFSENVLVGLWGLFLSPGKSVFLYSPVLLLSLPGVVALARARASLLIAIVLTTGPVVILYARYLFWHGDWAWGPRYLVFALPVWFVPGALWLSRRKVPIETWRLWMRRATIFALAGAALAVQVLGTAFVWDDFINVTRQARRSWLGVADLGGAVVVNDDCGACFEELHPVAWLPPFNPISGHLWLLRHKLARDGWRDAQRDAPWRRYADLDLDIAASYERARVDVLPLSGGRPIGAAFALVAAVLAILRLRSLAARVPPAPG